MPDHTTSLFPILPAGPTGMAKFAAEAEHVDDGHLVEFRALQVAQRAEPVRSRRWLSLAGVQHQPVSRREFGCRYCYARYTHEFLAPGSGRNAAGPAAIGCGKPDRDPEAFERVIFLKQNAAWLLEQGSRSGSIPRM